ncbi:MULTISPECIES: hypothetical protein [unclassified Oceanispirochaeta]|uniref:hypothetical protein n=1 Tax=unclassified Oceanispirochaeta TaxID=2635722 RepID=UPI000E092642|nr:MULTISPECIES: hypothetical protein [unclassified Oceanispirochaeta]MBF9017093.1 hypothetical protein [Oceanispirochaeta sp. M2]NPD73542.1 hypothetical protein [Oceanispirochaeta sp. M1]RDG30647.1 hypothetical protein DV872_15710 [Oceanispirochaeta sp. M1]
MKSLKRTQILLLSLIILTVVLLLVFRDKSAGLAKTPEPVEEAVAVLEEPPQVMEPAPAVVEEPPLVREELVLPEATFVEDAPVVIQALPYDQPPLMPEPGVELILEIGQSAILPDDWKNFVTRSSESIEPPGKDPVVPEPDVPVIIAVEEPREEIPEEVPVIIAADEPVVVIIPEETPVEEPMIVIVPEETPVEEPMVVIVPEETPVEEPMVVIVPEETPVEEPMVVIVPEETPVEEPMVVIVPEETPVEEPMVVIVPEETPVEEPMVVIVPEETPVEEPMVVIVPEEIPVEEPVLIVEEEPLEEEPAALVIAPPEAEPEEIVVEELVIEEAVEEIVEVPVVLIEGPRILIDSPRPDGYYRSSLLLEGKCIPVEEGDEDSRVRSLTWKIPGMGDYTNTVFMDENGSFQMDLMTAGLEGTQVLILESEDFAGRVSRQSFNLQDGNQPPGIVTDVETAERSYGALLAVKGQLIDPYKGIAGLEGIQSLTYRLVPQDRELGNEALSGSIRVESDGSFNMALNMKDRMGEQMLQLEARGNNDSQETVVIRLVPGSGDIPSFAMEPQDGRLVFSWEEVSGALEQNLYLNNNPGVEPDKNPVASFTNIKPPLVLDRTVNGRLYRAKLEILTEEGRFWSEVSEAVPLAPGTLDLKAEGGFEQVRLSWNSISAADSFRIWRRTEDEEKFSLLVDNHRGQEYIDATATYGVSYFYRIEPAAVSGPLSYAVPAASVESPSEKITLSSHYRQIIPEKISVQGDYAYIAAGDGGFHIMDISIPQKPESIGFLDQKGVKDVYLGEEYVYLASGDEGFQVVNIEEPTRPYTVMSRVTPGALSVAGRDNFVFLADSQLGLQIFDISDRQNPQRLSTMRDLKITQLDLQDSYLYGAMGDDGMVLVDISNPYSPRLVNTIDEFPVHDILVKDGLIYLACGSEGMIIYEKRSESEWNELSRFASRDARMIRLWEDYAMIADGKGGMKAVDVSRPEDPRNFGIFGGTEVKALAMADDYALLADIGGLKVVRTYLFGQSFVQHNWVTPGKAYGVIADGQRLWVTDRQGGVSVYQAGSPANMNETSLLRRFDTDFAEDILIKDDVLYVADGPGGVKLFRLSDSSPEPMLVHPVTGRARRIIPYGSQLAVISSGEGLIFLDEDTGGSHNLTYASRFYSTDPRDAAFYGTSLFLGDNKDGLILAEKLDDQFMETERFTEYLGIRQLMIRGDILYVLHKKGVTLLDIRNPEHPVIKAVISSNDAESMQYKGDLFYLSEGIMGLSVYRIDDALQPLKVSLCEDVFAVDAAPSGSYAYVADMDGISVLKVIVPEWK